MPLVKDNEAHYVTAVKLGANLRGTVTVSSNGVDKPYEIGFSGMGNCVADAYVALVNHPDFSGFTIDYSDIAPEFPGSGGAQLLNNAKTLDEFKAEAKLEISRQRNIAEAGGFEAYGKMFDSDAASLQRIALAIDAARAVGDTFSVDWTCQDNSVLTMDYAMLINMPIILAQHGSALHAKSRALKSQIDAATTFEEVGAIIWA